MEKDLFPIGRVIRPHGIKGKIKVQYFGEDLNKTFPYRRVVIEGSADGLKTYEVLEAIPQPPYLILRLKGVEMIEDAQPLVGKKMLIGREVLPELKEDEYYWVDVLGLAVETEEGRRIGKVKKIFPTGANDVYVIEGKRGEIFLPATEKVIKSIDLRTGVMKVHRMEGLWEKEDEI